MSSITLEGLAGSGELWLDIMRIICGDTSDKIMIDLGCHKAPYTPQLGFKDRLYIDIQDRGLDFPEEQPKFLKRDAIEFLRKVWGRMEPDVCIASDFIEHLTKEKGQELIALMGIATKIIIFTPLGDASVTNDGHPDSHASGWLPEDFPDWLCIVLPNFHAAINLGAFFSIECVDEEKQRIHNEIKAKYVEN